MTVRSDDEYDEVYLESAIGYGGIEVGPDGVGHPIPESEALEHAIPLWVDIPEHIGSAMAMYVEALSRPEPKIRLAAATAIGEVVRRYHQLPHEEGARKALSIALQDSSADVASAAARTIALIGNVLDDSDDASSNTR
jgi:hypothetical protein